MTLADRMIEWGRNPDKVKGPDIHAEFKGSHTYAAKFVQEAEAQELRMSDAAHLEQVVVA